jgi:hypothetical protein
MAFSGNSATKVEYPTGVESIDRLLKRYGATSDDHA